MVAFLSLFGAMASMTAMREGRWLHLLLKVDQALDNRLVVVGAEHVGLLGAKLQGVTIGELVGLFATCGGLFLEGKVRPT